LKAELSKVLAKKKLKLKSLRVSKIKAPVEIFQIDVKGLG
jgi:hypothetical protein